MSLRVSTAHRAFGFVHAAVPGIIPVGVTIGAVFQLIPQRFANRMGLVTGVVEAAGGLGGLLPSSALGAVRDVTGTCASGLMIFAAAFLIGALVLLELGRQWATRWQPDTVKQAGIFCYRGVIRGLLGEEPA